MTSDIALPHDEQNNQEIILIDDNYFDSLIDDINHANHSIDFETYIFNNDTAGIHLSDALCQAARRGVNIRVLVDGIGTHEWGGEITQKMMQAGILTKIYHPLPWLVRHWNYSNHTSPSTISTFLTLLSKINLRNHRKTCIIDDKIIYIGSANITAHLIKTEDRNNIWRETTVKLIGENTELLRYAFDKAWGHIPIKRRIQATLSKISADPVVRLNYSWRLRHKLYRSLLARIINAKKRIWVANAYFVPDSRLLKKLLQARKKGVEVCIILPNKSDVFITSLASKTFYATLLQAGIYIYEYLPTILHEKVLIIDDWYLVGSSNLNFRSIKHDLEADANLQSHTAKKTLESQFIQDLQQSKQIQLHDIGKQSYFQYLVGRFVLLIRYWI